jgi:uncharacterized membrane protein YdbT with pleckstrin-like domain
MSFVQKNLSVNETIIYQTKLHWWIFVSAGILLLLGLLLTNFVGLGWLLIVGALVKLVLAYLNWTSSEFVITNKRVILKTGFIRRRLVEIQLNKAEGLIVNQGLVGRMLNFGSVLVSSGGMNNSFGPMDAPFNFKKQSNEALETYATK